MFHSLSSLSWFTDALIQGSILLVLALVLNSLTRRTSAAWRYSLLFFTCIGIPLLFVISLFPPLYQIPQNKILLDSFETIVTHSTTLGELDSSLKEPSSAHNQAPAPTSTPSFLESTIQMVNNLGVSAWLMAIWILGVATILIRISTGVLSLKQLNSKPTDNSSKFAQLIAQEAASFGLTNSPEFVLLQKDEMPMTWYSEKKHFIALPCSAKEWTEKKLRNIIRHELAHIRRNDFRTSWLADASLALLWFHPLAWKLRKALSEAREAACDDLSLGQTPDPNSCHEYARDLLDVISSHSRKLRTASLALAMANHLVSVRKRLNSILDTKRNRRPVSPKAHFLTIPLGLLALSVLASLTACRTTEPPSNPRSFRSSGTHVQVNFQTFEFEDTSLLNELFETSANQQNSGLLLLTALLSPEELERTLKKLTKAGLVHQTYPTVVGALGKKTRLELFREFIYPSEYDPPQITPPTDSQVDNEYFPVTPSTPTAFKTKPIGILHEVTALHAGKEGISLDMSLEHNRFLGFINYGSPITTPARNIFGKLVDVTVTENRIEMPIFQAHKYETNIFVPFGHTIALIGHTPRPDANMDPRLKDTIEKDKWTLPPQATLYLIQPQFVDAPKNEQ